MAKSTGLRIRYKMDVCVGQSPCLVCHQNCDGWPGHDEGCPIAAEEERRGIKPQGKGKPTPIPCA